MLTRHAGCYHISQVKHSKVDNNSGLIVRSKSLGLIFIRGNSDLQKGQMVCDSSTSAEQRHLFRVTLDHLLSVLNYC